MDNLTVEDRVLDIVHPLVETAENGRVVHVWILEGSLKEQLAWKVEKLGSLLLSDEDELELKLWSCSSLQIHLLSSLLCRVGKDI